MSDKSKTPQEQAEEARKILEERRRFTEAMEKDLAVFRRIVKGRRSLQESKSK